MPYRLQRRTQQIISTIGEIPNNSFVFSLTLFFFIVQKSSQTELPYILFISFTITFLVYIKEIFELELFFVLKV